VIAQQTVFAQTGLGANVNLDQWDGYVAQRRRITEFLGSPSGPVNPVIISGDLHSSWVNDVQVDYDDPASPTVATEFAGTSISSGFTTAIAPVTAALAEHPYIRDFDGDQRGYVVTRVDRSRWTSDFRVVDTVDSPTSPARLRRSWTVEDGIPGAHPT
jgi:alkaline phosphatase D